MASGSRIADDAPRSARRPDVPGSGRAVLVSAVSIGALCVVAGGLVAAVSAPAPSEKASWSAAYLVLVAGVAQIGLAAGRAFFPGGLPIRAAWVQVVGWNAGNALVMVGTLAGPIALVDGGGVLLLAALLLAAPGLRRLPGRSAPAGRRLLWAYRAFVLVLLVSIPVGLLLARLRS